MDKKITITPLNILRISDNLRGSIEKLEDPNGIFNTIQNYFDVKSELFSKLIKRTYEYYNLILPSNNPDDQLLKLINLDNPEPFDYLISFLISNHLKKNK